MDHTETLESPAESASVTPKPVPKGRPLSRRIMHLVRRTHLYLGLFLFPWAILYGVTGFLFNHPTLFADAPTTHFSRADIDDEQPCGGDGDVRGRVLPPPTLDLLNLRGRVEEAVVSQRRAVARRAGEHAVAQVGVAESGRQQFGRRHHGISSSAATAL